MILEPRRGAAGPADGGQPQLARQSVRRSAKLDLGALGADRFGGQVSEEKASVRAVGEPDESMTGQAKAVSAIDPLESVAVGPAMGEDGQHQKPRHEAEGPGRKRVRRLERMHDLC